MGVVIVSTPDGRNIKSNNITYDDLVILCKLFVDKHGIAPEDTDYKSENNLPSFKTVKRILLDKRVTYKEFLAQFGIVTNVPALSGEFDLYFDRFISLSNNKGCALSCEDLENNKMMPKPRWFVKHCPDKSVGSYEDFVAWSGFQPSQKR